MDDHELRRIEQMVKAAEDLFELPPKERMCVVSPRQIIKEYRLDRYGELLVWICKDDSGKKFVMGRYQGSTGMSGRRRRRLGG
jgi:hypothetical protein